MVPVVHAVPLMALGVALAGAVILPMWGWLKRGSNADALLGRMFRLSPEASTLSTFDDGIILEASDGMSRLCGYSHDELVGHSTLELGLWADDTQRDALRAALAGAGSVDHLRVRIRRKDGRELDTAFSARLVEVDGRQCLLATAHALAAAPHAHSGRYALDDLRRPALTRTDAMVVTSLPDGRVLDMNQGFCRLTGWPQDEAIGRNTLELGLWVEPTERMALITSLLGSGAVDQAEYRFRRKDGTLFTGLTSSMRVALGPGLVCAVTTVVDITSHAAEAISQRRLAGLEQLLAATSARFLDLPAERLVAGLAGTLADLGRILDVDRCQVLRFQDAGALSDSTGAVSDCIAEWVSPGVTPLMARMQHQTLGRWWHEHLGRGEALAIAATTDIPDAAFRAEVEGQKTRAFLHLPLIHAHRTVGALCLAVTRAPRTWNADELVLLQTLAGIVASALVRSGAESALVSREQDLRTILDSIGDAVVVVDAQGRITRLNPVAERLAGNATAGFIGQHFTEVFPLFDATSGRCRHDLLDLAAQGRLVPSGQTVLRTRDGREIPLQEGGAPLRRSDGTVLGLVLVFRDVSELRQLEEMLRQSHKMDAMGQLAGGVAHDFNNMLAGILGFAELLTAHLAGNDEDEQLARRIVRTAERAAGLTRQLLAFSRKGRLLSRNIDLHRVVEDTISILRRTIDPRIEIHAALAAERTITSGDPGLVENAILNLGLNARDAMPDGGRLTLSSRNLILAASDPLCAAFDIPAGEYLEIAVTDTGIGMSPEVLNKLFLPFFTTKERGKGTGLGLAAVYGILKDHHGAVWAESQLGAGSTFRVVFPLAHEQSAVETGLFRARPRLGTGCVLVVDDEPAVRDMATAVLQDLGYEVMQAVDGPSGLDTFAIHRERIGLVLLDLVMPRMHGRDVMARLRQIDPGIPILLSSGYAQDANLDELTAQPLVDFLQKPYRIPDLGQRVAELMRGT